ncbi:hypothetical protein [Mucilaginibacter sp.]|uniref:hypothetical protein n=1 Tax=Mucilaginibacter sp. TaxID=1882438 RepID=UPI0035BC4B50
METLTIHVPEKKSKLIKSLLKELGVKIESSALDLALKINSSVKPGPEITMDEIVEEVRAHRVGK